MLKSQLQKGLTITPQMFMHQTMAGAEPTLIGFSGMTELDYVATHIAAALFQKYDPEQVDVISLSVDAAEKLLQKSENVKQMRMQQAQQLMQQQQQQEEQEKANAGGQIIGPDDL